MRKEQRYLSVAGNESTDADGRGFLSHGRERVHRRDGTARSDILARWLCRPCGNKRSRSESAQRAAARSLLVDAPYELEDGAVNDTRRSHHARTTKDIFKGTEDTAPQGVVRDPVYEIGGRGVGGIERDAVNGGRHEGAIGARQDMLHERGGVVREAGGGAIYEMAAYDRNGS